MLLIRHAQSEWNDLFTRTRVDAGPADPVLTAAGREQAAAAAERLAEMNVAQIVASPYRRCLQTADVIAKRLGLSIKIDPLVRERCAFSCDQGSQPTELRREWPFLSFEALSRDWWGRSIESQASVSGRAWQFRSQAAAWLDEPRMLVVSHWGFLRALTNLEVENGAIVRYDPSSGKSQTLPNRDALEAIL